MCGIIRFGLADGSKPKQDLVCQSLECYSACVMCFCRKSTQKEDHLIEDKDTSDGQLTPAFNSAERDHEHSLAELECRRAELFTFELEIARHRELACEIQAREHGALLQHESNEHACRLALEGQKEHQHTRCDEVHSEEHELGSDDESMVSESQELALSKELEHRRTSCSSLQSRLHQILQLGTVSTPDEIIVELANECKFEQEEHDSFVEQCYELSVKEAQCRSGAVFLESEIDKADNVESKMLAECNQLAKELGVVQTEMMDEDGIRLGHQTVNDCNIQEVWHLQSEVERLGKQVHDLEHALAEAQRTSSELEARMTAQAISGTSNSLHSTSGLSGTGHSAGDEAAGIGPQLRRASHVDPMHSSGSPEPGEVIQSSCRVQHTSQVQRTASPGNGGHVGVASSSVGFRDLVHENKRLHLEIEELRASLAQTREVGRDLEVIPWHSPQRLNPDMELAQQSCPQFHAPSSPSRCPDALDPATHSLDAALGMSRTRLRGAMQEQLHSSRELLQTLRTGIADAEQRLWREQQARFACEQRLQGSGQHSATTRQWRYGRETAAVPWPSPATPTHSKCNTSATAGCQWSDDFSDFGSSGESDGADWPSLPLPHSDWSRK